MENDLTYPFHTMHITQSYDGKASHLPHMTGTPKEYAIDEAGIDGGRDWVYCPCDKMKVTKLTGVGKAGTNAVYLTSTDKCDLANGKKAIVTIQLVHPNDDDLKKLYTGQIFKRGEKICREGTDGNATGNHVHMAVGLGSIVGSGWQCNNKNKWVLVTTGGPIKPEDAFFLDRDFTTVRSSHGLVFKSLPAAKQAPAGNAGSAASSPKGGAVPGTYRVTARTLNVRSGTSTKTAIKGTLHAGDAVPVSKVKTGLDGQTWGKIDGKGWICLAYAEKVIP